MKENRRGADKATQYPGAKPESRTRVMVPVRSSLKCTGAAQKQSAGKVAHALRVARGRPVQLRGAVVNGVEDATAGGTWAQEQ